MSELDDIIRRGLQQSAQPPVDPSGAAAAVQAKLAAAGGAGSGATGGAAASGGAGGGAFGVIGGLLAVALIAGIGVGFGLGGSDTTHHTLRLVRSAAETVTFYACPGADARGAFHRGDRVVSLARSKDGKWTAVRSPDNLRDAVWVDNASLVHDSSIAGLPVRSCDDVGAVAVADSDQSSVSAPEAPTTTAVESTTTTSTVAPTTTTKTGPKPTVTTPITTPATTPSTAPTTTPATTTTAAHDTTPPAFGTVTTSKNPIAENAPGLCTGISRTSVIGASVSDSGGVASVTMSWTVNGVAVKDESNRTSVAMSLSGGTYKATLGTFGTSTVAYPTPTAVIVVTVRATDTAGNVTTKSIIVTIDDCTLG